MFSWKRQSCWTPQDMRHPAVSSLFLALICWHTHGCDRCISGHGLYTAGRGPFSLFWRPTTSCVYRVQPTYPPITLTLSHTHAQAFGQSHCMSKYYSILLNSFCLRLFCPIQLPLLSGHIAPAVSTPCMPIACHLSVVSVDSTGTGFEPKLEPPTAV